jgi:hypothetical protein
MNNSFSYKTQKSRAQTMVEFALALPILLTLLYGVLETGRLLFIYASTVTAARQAVRYGSTTGISPNGVFYFQDCVGIEAAAQRVGFINDFQNILIKYDEGPDGVLIEDKTRACPADEVQNGDRILVQVEAEWQPIVPIVPLQPFTIRSESARTILATVYISVTALPAGWTGTGGGKLELAVSPSSATYTTAGQIITYTYTLTNIGTEALLAPYSVVDTKAGSNCQTAGPGILDIFASFTCTGTYQISQADMDAGFVTSEATATANGLPSNTETTTITALQAAELTLSKTASPTTASAAGQTITYTYTLENSGNVTLTAPYSVADNKIATVNCAGATSPLIPGATTSCTATYTITNNDLNSLVVVNEAFATANFGDIIVTSNNATETVITAPLILTVTTSPSAATQAGQTITYTYTVTNNRETTASAINVTDNKLTITCADGTTLAPGASLTCTAMYITTQADMDNGTALTSTANATGNNEGQPILSNTVTTLLLISQTKSLNAVVTAAPPPGDELPEGTEVAYTYTLTNSGNVTLTSPFAITDDKVTASCTDQTDFAPGESRDCAGTYTITADDALAGRVTNTGTASAYHGTQLVESAPTSTTVVTYAGPRFGVGIGALIISNVVNYTYTLTNQGGVTLTAPYSVTSSLGPVDCSLGAPTLAPGASTTCTSTYTATAPGEVTNTVTAATASNGTVAAFNTPVSITTPVNVCNSTTLYYTVKPTSGTDVTWTINNASGMPLTIQSVTIIWDSQGNRDLLRVYFPTSPLTSIWGPGANGSGNFTLPDNGWTLNTGTSSIRVTFSRSTSNINIIISFVNQSCSLQG